MMQHKLLLSNGNSGMFTHSPIIYKITNKITNLSYIGRSGHVFTKRWYEHFFKLNSNKLDTKFQEALNQFSLIDWTFEVIEIIETPIDLFSKENHNIKWYDIKMESKKRERYWIDFYNTLNNGYNSI